MCLDCLGRWVAAGFSARLWLATRATAGMCCGYARADWVQLADGKLKGGS